MNRGLQENRSFWSLFARVDALRQRRLQDSFCAPVGAVL